MIHLKDYISNVLKAVEESVEEVYFDIGVNPINMQVVKESTNRIKFTVVRKR